MKRAQKFSDSSNMIELTHSDPVATSIFTDKLAVNLTIAKCKEIPDSTSSLMPESKTMVRRAAETTVGKRISDGTLDNQKSPVQKLAIKDATIARDYIRKGKLTKTEEGDVDLAIAKLVSVVRKTPDNNPSPGNVRRLQGRDSCVIS